MRNQAILAATAVKEKPIPLENNDKVDLGLINKFAYELGSSGINIGPRKETPPILKKTLSSSRHFSARGGGAFRSERPPSPSERA